VKQLEQFLRRLDAAIVSTDVTQTTFHAYDATNEFHYPEAVVRPRDSEELHQIVLSANEYHVPLFPRGAGTGFSGGSLAVDGGVVIDFLGLNKVLDLDEDDMLVRVQPGVVTLHLQKLVESHKLYFPPDPASLKICTIGGNVAENAGGPHCLKYGVTRDYVLAIDGFTGDGRPFAAGKAIHKNRAGYDLRHLLIGSEGTLAVFSAFTLKLIPRPETRILFLAWFRAIHDAAAMVNQLLHRGIMPSSIEFMDEGSIKAVEQHAHMGLPTGFQALLLIEIDGRHDEMPLIQKRVEDCLSTSASNIQVAHQADEQEKLWEVRRKASPAMRQFGNKKANQDIVVPRKSIPTALDGLKHISQRHRINVINFGHIGDGNIHVNIMYDGNNPDDCQRAELAVHDLFDLVNSLGGSISGEHGIGLAKKKHLPRNIDTTSYDLMRAIKRDFDPHGILNPRKIFL